MDFSKHTDNTTSVKVHHAPGGKSSFSLSWDAEPQQVVGKSKPVMAPQNNVQSVMQNQTQNTNNAQTSVKVRAPPGGKSNFTLG